MKKKINDFLLGRNMNFLRDHQIRELLTIHVGGKVGFIIFTDSRDQLLELLFFLHAIGKNFILIGGGSNIIFPDHGSELVVIINRSGHIKILDENKLRIDSGLKNSDFLEFCRKNGISGFEFLAGIPGTMGGAAAVNAGAFGLSVSDRVLGGEIFTANGTMEYREHPFFGFVYRNSRFKFGTDVIISIDLTYSKGDRDDIEKKVRETVKLRHDKHPSYSSFTAGCFFKNPEVNGKKLSAGKLIEQCRLKAYDTGPAMISRKHSNFIVNKGDASFSDIEALGKKVQAAVKKQNGIELEREVIFVSPDGVKY